MGDQISDQTLVITMVVLVTNHLAHNKILASWHHFNHVVRLQYNRLARAQYMVDHKVAKANDLHKEVLVEEVLAEEAQEVQEVLEDPGLVVQVEEDKVREELVVRVEVVVIQERKAMDNHQTDLANRALEDLSNLQNRALLLQRATDQRRLQRWVSQCRSKMANARLCKCLVPLLLVYCIV